MKIQKQSKNHILCSCTSKKWYEECCQPYHNGVVPESALLLMRSRYSAYALQLADYIIRTTHPDNPAYSVDFQNWKKEILQFCTHTRFEGYINSILDKERDDAYAFDNSVPDRSDWAMDSWRLVAGRARYQKDDIMK